MTSGFLRMRRPTVPRPNSTAASRRYHVGVGVTASLDRATYPTKVKVSRETMGQLDLERHEVCPNWNYTIGPRRTVLRN